MITIIEELRDSIETEIQTELGSEYSKLPYVESPEANHSRKSNNGYGVRPLLASQVSGVTRTVQFNQSFEVVLTKTYCTSGIGDSEQIQASLDNRSNMLSIYKRLIDTKAGLPSIVLNITDLILEEPEYLTEEKVVIQRSTFNIFYRFNL